MKASVTITFSALLMVVLAFYFFLMPESRIREPLFKVRGGEPEARLLPLETADEVERIHLHRKEEGKAIHLQRAGEGWMLKKPVAGPADPVVAEGLVSALTLTTKAKRLTRDKEWKEYGLADPAVKIAVQTQKHPEKRWIHLGDHAPIGDYIFARGDSEKEYFLLNADLKKVFQVSLYSLRIKKIFKTPLADVSRLFVRADSGNYELSQHGEDGQWFWMEPIALLGEKAKPEHVTKVLAQIRDLHVKEFLDEEKGGKREVGISLIGRSVKAWGKDQQTELLQLGQALPERDAFFAAKEGEAALFLVARGNVSDLFTTLEAFAREASSKTTLAKPNP